MQQLGIYPVALGTPVALVPSGTGYSSGTGTQWHWVPQSHWVPSGTGTQWHWYPVALVPSGTGTQLTGTGAYLLWMRGFHAYDTASVS